MTDIELAAVLVLVAVLLVLPADLVLLRGAPVTSARPLVSCPALDWPCRHDKSSADCPERNGGECDG